MTVISLDDFGSSTLALTCCHSPEARAQARRKGLSNAGLQLWG